MASDGDKPRWMAIVQLDGSRAVIRTDTVRVEEHKGETFVVYPSGVYDRISEFVGYLRTDADVIPYLRG